MDRLDTLPDGRRAPLPPSKRASYHYLIGKDGMIVRTVHPRMIANHAGKSSFPRLLPDTASLPRVAGVNAYTIGVSFANDNGSDANPNDDDLTPEQVASGLWLGTVLQETWGYSPLRNWGHCEVSPGRKTDPLPRILDMSLWRGMLSLAEWPRDVDVTSDRVVSICGEV
jgi:N-acetyl-anhydromuramyl-L-alanine amidase AmpD